MADLNIFLSDSFQYELKSQAAEKSNSRFENTLQNYFELFFVALENLESSHKVDTFSHISSTTRSKLYDWIDGAQNALKSEIIVYRELFNELIDCYKLFIKGDRLQATQHIFEVLKKYDMNDIINPGELGLFFKGRTIRENDKTDVESYYYHIPFDKRFLVSNQRFSFSGQPILYIGSSLLDVLYELRCDTDHASKIAIASFGYDPLIESTINTTTGKNFEKLKIYDVTNHIHKLINGILLTLTNGSLPIPKFDDPLYRPNSEDIKNDFKKFILTQICTFKRIHEHNFIEEYVPAQILTEALRLNGYNGVKFPSTQFDGKDLRNQSIFYPSIVQENLALFAEYFENEVFDVEQMKHFFITPLTHENSFTKSSDEYKAEITKLTSEIVLAVNNNMRSLKSKISESMMNVGQVHHFESNLLINDKPYFSHDFARMELFAQLSYLKQLKRQTEYYSNGLLKTHLEK